MSADKTTPTHSAPTKKTGSSPYGRRIPAAPGRPGSGWFVWLLFVMVIALILSSLRHPARTEIPTWTMFEKIVRDAGLVPESVVMRNDRVEAELKADFQTDSVEKPNGEKQDVYVDIDEQNREFYLQRLNTLGVAWKDETGSTVWFTLLLAWGPLLIILLLVGFMIYRARRAMESGPTGLLGKFGQSRHSVADREAASVTLADVAGVEDAKAEVRELIDFLKTPDKFRSLGARIPKGVLLVGPPGCGKTLLARAIAGEADVPFFSVSGSDFMEMFVGVGASRVRDLFSKAKQAAPSIIFFDEIDTVGRRRGGNPFGGDAHGEREQTLNAILSEMDGFEPNDHVIAIAATNRPGVLDPALTRRGRFDRQVFLPLPDLHARSAILKIHARKVRLADQVDLNRLARSTPMFSGADLAAMINEAAIIAALKDRAHVNTEDLQEARDKIRFGRSRSGRNIEREQRVLAAYHEAGHALVQMMLDDADPVEKITIIPRGRAMGATLALPEKDRYSYGKRYLDATLRTLCAGRVAEAKKTGDISSGAQDDIKKATELVKKMVLEWGMSERLGFVQYCDDDQEAGWLMGKAQSEETGRQIDEEIRGIVGNAYEDAEQIIHTHWDSVIEIAEELLKRETLVAEDLERILRAPQEA